MRNSFLKKKRQEVLIDFYQNFRNLSQGSPDTGFFGSMEKEKRRKKLDDGRVAPEDVINELMEGVDLKQDANHDEAESKFFHRNISFQFH